MSSGILRSKGEAEGSPIAWRVAGAPAPSRETAKSSTPEPRTADRQEDTEALTRAAYAQGLAAGETAARERAQQKLDPVLNGLNSMIAELAASRKRVRAEAEDDAVKLAIAIARRVLYREIATDPEAILGLVKAAFSKLNARETHRLRVSPSDVAVVQEYRAKLQLPPGLEIYPDGALTSGSAIFETARGELDASVDTQLSEIERGLTDTLKRRK
jgi:flagellar assembly protein FliH